MSKRWLLLLCNPAHEALPSVQGALEAEFEYYAALEMAH